MFGFLKSLIRPEASFEIIRGEIERQLKDRPADLEFFGVTKENLDLKDFDTIIIKEKETVDFNLLINGKNRTYPFEDGKTLTKIIKEQVSKAVEGYEVDIAIIRYRNGSISGTLAYKKPDGTKEKKEIEL